MSDYQQLVAKTFLDPIKNVLVIDDQFPSYNDMTEQNIKEMDIPRARDIFNFFQDEHEFFCSFQNKFEDGRAKRISKTLNNSDLIILDYHLNKNDDSKLALEIIDEIAKSSNFNLIIVYTAAANDNPARTIFEILVHLCHIDEWKAHDEIKDFVYSEDRYSEILNSVTVEHAIEFICGGNKNLKELSTKANIIIPLDKKKTIKANDIVNYALYDKYPELKCAIGTHRNIIADIGSFPYIKGNNFFITVAGKDSVKPHKLWEHLEHSLKAWHPEPVLLTLQGLLNELHNNAPKHIDAVLKDEDMVKGWLLHATKDVESPGNLKRLANNLMSELSTSVTDHFFEANKNNFSPDKFKSDLCDSNVIKVIHALNRYLCTYNTVFANHLTTGIVLFNENINEKEYWLVLNCSCDLVPGQKFPWKENTTKPWQPFTAVKMVCSSCAKHLAKAEHGECIFINHKNQNLALQFRNDSNPNPHYEVFYAKNEGRFTYSKKLNARRFVIDKAKLSPTLKPMKFEVIAQLRYEYACRFLQMLVSNKGRIGVDFVSLPK